jgi:hypothetical protein
MQLKALREKSHRYAVYRNSENGKVIISKCLSGIESEDKKRKCL